MLEAQKGKQGVRKSAPTHLGRRTQQEKDALAAQQRIHAPRNLKKMLEEGLKRYPNPDLCTRDAMQVLKHWLMDIEHQLRMENRPDDQDVVGRIIQQLDADGE